MELKDLSFDTYKRTSKETRRNFAHRTTIILKRLGLLEYSDDILIKNMIRVLSSMYKKILTTRSVTYEDYLRNMERVHFETRRLSNILLGYSSLSHESMFVCDLMDVVERLEIYLRDFDTYLCR